MSRLKFAVWVAPLLMAATFASADVRIYVQTAPPRVVTERRPPAPGRGYVWIRGHHSWEDGRHVWVRGRWEARPRHEARWRDGRWRRDRQRGWYWTEGGWRR